MHKLPPIGYPVQPRRFEQLSDAASIGERATLLAVAQDAGKVPIVIVEELRLQLGGLSDAIESRFREQQLGFSVDQYGIAREPHQLSD